MNKNVLIGILVLIIIVLGYVTFSGNVDLQQANIIKTQGVELSTARDQAVEFAEKDGGTIEIITSEELQRIGSSSGRVMASVSSGTSNQRPYTCYMQIDGGGVYMYSYNSLYDHGNVWQINNTWMCFANS